MKLQLIRLLAVLILSWAGSAFATVRVNSLFTDGAVLQQGREVPVWGTANTGEKVTVTFLDQRVTTVAKDGRWLVKLKPLKAGVSGTLTIQGENTVTVQDVVAGEVWLCSGQSNMAFQLFRASTAAEAIPAAADPHLRLFRVARGSADAPTNDAGGSWAASTPLTASNFSAVAYFFGRDLRRALKVPVGLIDSSVGGTPAEAWTSRETLESNPTLRVLLDKHAASRQRFEADKASGKHDQALAKYRDAVRHAKAAGTPAPKAPDLTDPARSSRRPTGLYNAMIAPLQPFPLAGAIWYQGEAPSISRSSRR
jgi:sialate O-acetylesterase